MIAALAAPQEREASHRTPPLAAAISKEATLRRALRVLSALLVILAGIAFAQSDKSDSKDYPGITRMPNFYIYDYSDTQFDSVNFAVSERGKKTERVIEGRTIKIQYVQKENTPASSMLQIIRNLQNPARAAGGQVLDDSRGDNWYNTTLRLTREGKEVWVLIKARSDSYWQSVVKSQPMQQEVVIDATSIGNSLDSNGRVALYGIYFDTAKSDLKPESDATLAEISKLLKQQPTLKVFIVGHTDTVSDPAANVKLWLARAQSVANALSGKYGIANARLTPFGNRPLRARSLQQNRRRPGQEPARRTGRTRGQLLWRHRQRTLSVT